MYPNHFQNLLHAFLPAVAGVAFSLIAFRLVGRKWKIADPDLEEMWVESLRVLRIGGPALILVGVLSVMYVINNAL
jgi:hypothetical protein